MITSATLSPIELFQSGEPGIYPGIPASIYHGLDAVSNSRLKPLYNEDQTPAHCKSDMDIGVAETEAMRIGTGTHAWILEPETLERDFAVAQRCAARVKSTGKQCTHVGSLLYDGEWFCKTSGHCPGDPDDCCNRTVISQADWDRMAQMRNNVYDHLRAAELLESAGDNELSLIATHEPTGLAIKSRFDAWRPGRKTIVDIKTSDSASVRKFGHKIEKLHYFKQAALYQYIARQSGLDAEFFAFIVIEKTAPYPVNVVVPHQYQLDAEMQSVEESLRVYAECQTSGIWPAYPMEYFNPILSKRYGEKLLDMMGMPY